MLTGIGFAWACISAQWALDDRLAPELDERTLWLEGRVAGLPEVREGVVRFEVHQAKSRRARALLFGGAAAVCVAAVGFGVASLGGGASSSTARDMNMSAPTRCKRSVSTRNSRRRCRCAASTPRLLQSSSGEGG